MAHKAKAANPKVGLSTLKKLAGVGAVATLNSMPSDVYRPQPAHKDPYRVRDAISTLAQAEQIRCDKPLMREVKKLAKSVCK